MSFEVVKKMPTTEEIKETLAVSAKVKAIKEKRDEEIRKIFTGEDHRFILIIGPCSADNEEAVLDYTNRLGLLQSEVKDKILLLPRVYTNKPRTTGEGYKGMVHQPNPEKGSDMYNGILAIRKMHIKAIEESGLTCADEMLYPENYAYLDDILSYVAIGARSVENQQHRLVASGIDIPSGMKNPISGDISVMLNAIKASQIEHTFIYRGDEVVTKGNPLSHAIMRGAVNRYGTSIPNYHFEDIHRLVEEYIKRGLQNPAIIIDCNHSNSNKQYEQQPRIANEILANMKYSNEFKTYVKGLMIESYIEGGRQNIGDNVYGKSITDPCLGWAATKELVFQIADKL